MKKVLKFLFGMMSLAAITGGAYYVYKNYICKDSSDDFDDLDDFDDTDTDGDSMENAENREYVSIELPDESSDDKEEA